MIKSDSIQKDTRSELCNEFNPKTQKHCVSTTFKQQEKELWLLENQHAITLYNQHIADNGVFSDGLRCF